MGAKISSFFEAIESGDFNLAKKLIVRMSEKEYDKIIKQIFLDYVEKGCLPEAINIIENVIDGEERDRLIESVSRLH